MTFDLALDQLSVSGQYPQNIYICYSNLHAIQACLLSLDAPGLCFYTDAVSVEYLAQAFNGEQRLAPGVSGTLKDVLSFLTTKKQMQAVNVFVGCKVGYAALAVLNTFPRHQLYLLDDGLAMYGLSLQRPQPSGYLKRTLKRLLALLLAQWDCTYFSGDTVGSLDRRGQRLLLWPPLFTVSDAGENVELATRLGPAGQAQLAQYRNIAIAADRSIYVASYEKSLEIAAGHALEQHYDEILLHPRVAARDNSMPLEIYLLQYQQITMGMSSIILVLAYLGYRGHLILDADSHSRQVMALLSATINLPFSVSFLGDAQ